MSKEGYIDKKIQTLFISWREQQTRGGQVEIRKEHINITNFRNFLKFFQVSSIFRTK